MASHHFVLKFKFDPKICLSYALIILGNDYFSKAINIFENFMKQKQFFEIMKSERKQKIVTLVELKFIECLFCVRHHIKHFVCIIISWNAQSHPTNIVYQSWSQSKMNKKYNKMGNWGEFNKRSTFKCVTSIQKTSMLKCHEDTIVGSRRVGAITGIQKT